MKLILLGIDGAEPSLVFSWAEDGFLPNFARLIRAGAFGRCKSTTHPLTPQAWASIITGVGPGKHGIYDFGFRADGAYRFELADSRRRAWPAFWELLDEDQTIGVVNLPLSWPPDKVNGFFISGMHTPTLKDGVFPKGLEKELEGYVIDVMCHWYDRTDEFLADVTRMADTRHRLILDLVRRRPVDILFCVYVAADRVQHALWGLMTEKHRQRPGWGGGHGDAIFNVYRQMDRILGDYMALAEDQGATLVVVSDHGFGDLKKDVYLNAVLAKEGLLFFDPAKVRKHHPRAVPLAEDPTHDWQRKAFPDTGPAGFGTDEQIERGDADPRYKDFDTVDWKRTAAYSSGLFGNIWINLAGREPEGIVEPGRQYEKLRDRIARLLLDVKDPDDGRPIVDRVYRREELYAGPMVNRAPDLVVVMRDYSYITRGSTEFLYNTVVSEVVVNHTGNHRMHGIVGLLGPGIRKGAALTGASVYDIAPTVLHLAGRPVPRGLDGRVLENAFTAGMADAQPVRFGNPVQPSVKPGRGYTEEEKKIVEQRLRALGYLG